jgi:hypothetical protein
MNLIIDCSLTVPPSEIYCFRDVTLYAKTFVFQDILVQCEKNTRSMYWKWLKDNSIHDFVSYMLKPTEEEHGFKMAPKGGNLNIDRITADNLNFVIGSISSIKPDRGK